MKAHSINLVANVNPENPYEVELRHSTNGDPQMRWGDALVAFDLNGVLIDGGEVSIRQLLVEYFPNVGSQVVGSGRVIHPNDDI